MEYIKKTITTIVVQGTNEKNSSPPSNPCLLVSYPLSTNKPLMLNSLILPMLILVAGYRTTEYCDSTHFLFSHKEKKFVGGSPSKFIDILCCLRGSSLCENYKYVNLVPPRPHAELSPSILIKSA